MPGFDRLGLAEYLSGLQEALSEARLQTAGRDLTFSLDRVTVEADVSYTLTESSGASHTATPKFWVVESAEQSSDDRDGSDRRLTQRLSVQFNRRPQATVVDASEEDAMIAALPVAAPAKPIR